MIRRQALELDDHAYQVSDVYRGTGPAITEVHDADPADEADDEADEADGRDERARHLSHWLHELLDADHARAAARTTDLGARARLLLSRRR